MAAGLGGSHQVTIHAKMLRLELLQVKAELERNLGALVLDCTDCGQTGHYVSGVGITPGHWAHREPAPHGRADHVSFAEVKVPWPSRSRLAST